MKDKIILHVDANSFYASVECARHPELADKPVAVSGNPKKRNGIILAKNELAKKFGVQTAEAIWQAKDKCPNLICIYPNMSLYESYSQKLHKIFEKYTHLIEGMGLDECWLDVTNTAHLFGGAEKIAADIREQTKKQLGITVSVGISFCKLFAKLGSDLKKPDAQTVISRQNFAEIVYPLPIEAIIGIGSRMKKNLNKINVFTLGDFLEVPGHILKNRFSVVFYELRKKLLGFDNDPVKSIYSPDPPKSVGNGTTTLVDIFTEEEILETVVFLADKISARLRAKKFYSSHISVSIRTTNFKHFHKSQVLFESINSAKDIVSHTMKIIKSFWKFDEKIRSIRISCGHLSSDASIQLSVFQLANDKKNALNSALDEIREKYGKTSIQPASMLSTHIVRDNFS